MKSFTMCFPILPGKMDAWKAFSQELGHARKVEFDAMMKRCGVSRSRAWVQKTAQGELSFELHEGSSPDRMMQMLAKANDPFGTWFKSKMKECYGIDWKDENSAAQYVVDMKLDCSH